MNKVVNVLVIMMALLAVYFYVHLDWSPVDAILAVAGLGLAVALGLLLFVLVMIPLREWPEAFRIVGSTLAEDFREILKLFK